MHIYKYIFIEDRSRYTYEFTANGNNLLIIAKFGIVIDHTSGDYFHIKLHLLC